MNKLLETAGLFGLDELRSGQEEAMRAAVDGRDVLAVMASGHGKSAIFEVPAMMLDGVALVVSPLIALQRDQAGAINESVGKETAFVLNSTVSKGQQHEVWEAVEAGQAKFLFLAPEQLARAEVMERLDTADICLMVVDEAHCVSSWGHDFRPDYLHLGEAAERLKHPPLVALTATASTLVQREIVDELQMRRPKLLVRGFDRPNLHLAVERHVSDEDKRQTVVEQVAGLEGPGLLYTATRRNTETYRDELLERKVRAGAYHSGLRKQDRSRIHQQFLDGELDVVIATSAFGMGIDKPDVRFVIHADITDSPDSYYQEIGRGGRDGEPATIDLHYRPEDLGIRRFFISRHPDEDQLRAVFEAVSESPGADRRRLGERCGLSTRKLTGLLNLLEAAGAVRTDDGGYLSTGRLQPDKAAEKAVEKAHAHERIEASRLEMIRQYAETDTCRRQFLLGYFGEQLETPCGNCDTCEAGSAYETDQDDGTGKYPVQSMVEHSEWGPGIVMHHEDDRITVLFEEVGYKSLAVEIVEKENLLRRAGDEPGR